MVIILPAAQMFNLLSLYGPVLKILVLIMPASSKAQMSLPIPADSPEPSLLACTEYRKAQTKHLGLLDSQDGILEGIFTNAISNKILCAGPYM